METRTLSGRIGLPLVLVLAASVAAVAGWWLATRSAPSPASGMASASILVYPEPRPLARWELQQSDGTPLTPEELAGRPTLVFFGFTSCPDICPTTLARLAEAEKQWADLDESERPRILFVSVDPERDTPARAGEYAHWFSPSMLAATGSHDALQPFARSLGMVYMHTEGEDGTYSVDHSTSVAVLDARVRLAAVIPAPIDAARVARDLRALADGA
ncbi:MAG TPA: SCO family protein [Xanthomonadaceae bacterium]|nr:SCO family protein [Xanthomonadaceae bacterium]